MRRYWADNFPDWPVIEADSDTKIFSLSQARNNACRQVETDIVVFCDADTIPPTESVKIAVADPVGVTWPHAIWRLIPAEYAEKPFNTFPNAPALVEYPNGLGGVMVCTTEEYWRIGGQPPEFEGWGHEDRAFHIVAMTLSSFRRIGGVAYSIEHNQRLRVADSPEWHRDSRRNEDLMKPYEAASDNPWLMRELLKLRDEPREPGTDWRARSGATETDPIRRQLFGPRPPKPPPEKRPSWQERWTAGDNNPLAGRYRP